MALSKVMWAALKTITALEPNVKKTYKMERFVQVLTAKLRGSPKLYRIWDHSVYADGYAIPIRFFAPRGEGPLPLLLFFHGGGWVTGGTENYADVCGNLAMATGCIVAAVDYRLAPEHKFPTAPEDCYAAARAFFLGRMLKVDPDDITLIGDSAGGNLAAVVSLMARDRGEFMPKRQILLYPSTYNDHSEQSPFASIRDFGTDFLLTSKRIQSVIELYRSSDDDLCNPYFAPLLAPDLSGQPRTLIITAEYCPLRDEGEAYGEKLRAAGNEVEIVRVPDALHGYMMMPPRFELVLQTYRLINGFLQRGNLHGRT